MEDFIDHIKGDKGADVAKANWAMVRAKIKYSKISRFKSKVLIKVEKWAKCLWQIMMKFMPNNYGNINIGDFLYRKL